MILVVDDELENRLSLIQVLNREGWSCLEAENGEAALQILRDRPEVQLLITDMKMPGSVNGLELLQMSRKLRPDVQRLLITAFGTIEATVEAMRAGAFDVLTKPVKLKTLKENVSRLLENAPHKSHATTGPSTSVLAQLSPPYAKLMETLRRAAQSEAHVLFTGESGSGKSYLAKLLHEWSQRRDQAFVGLNCAAIPADLLESELFGVERGAFTGANASREGKVQAAHKGTLLLDEIGDMSFALQAKLLQLIQERRFYKLGSNKEINVDTRIVSATNKNLVAMIEAGQFREDLLYRLKVIEIHVPSLRERKQDLLWIIPNLLDSLAEKNHLPPVRLTHEALSLLWAYEWPGNIRELENVLESTLVLAPREDLREGLLGAQLLPEAFRKKVEALGMTPALAPMADLATIERMAIEQALAISGGRRKLAASLLGISERTLYRVLGAEPKT
ncbi:MAG: sigma-54 dependent transcriptional regulator [Bdellovibrionota bacterium]